MHCPAARAACRQEARPTCTALLLTPEGLTWSTTEGSAPPRGAAAAAAGEHRCSLCSGASMRLCTRSRTGNGCSTRTLCGGGLGLGSAEHTACEYQATCHHLHSPRTLTATGPDRLRSGLTAPQTGAALTRAAHGGAPGAPRAPRARRRRPGWRRARAPARPGSAASAAARCRRAGRASGSPACPARPRPARSAGTQSWPRSPGRSSARRQAPRQLQASLQAQRSASVHTQQGAAVFSGRRALRQA